MLFITSQQKTEAVKLSTNNNTPEKKQTVLSKEKVTTHGPGNKRKLNIVYKTRQFH